MEGLSENSYMGYGGKGFYVDSYHSSKLIFDNAKESVNIIPMSKEEAKNFLKHRKDRYGNIDREIIIHYVYKITGYEEDRKFTSDGYPMTIKFEGKLLSAEYMDKNKKHTLYKYEYENKSDSNSTVNNTKLEKKNSIIISWNEVSKDICEKSGGEMQYGLCKAPYENGNKICKAVGGKMPSEENFFNLIKECGGKLATKEDYTTFSGSLLLTSAAKENNKNKTLKECLNKHNIRYERIYWTRNHLKTTPDMKLLGNDDMSEYIIIQAARKAYDHSFKKKSIICVK